MPEGEEDGNIMACQKQVKTRIAALALLTLLLPFLPVWAADAETPTARQLLAMVRITESGQTRDLTGKLQTTVSDEKIKIPFLLTMRGNSIAYQFSEPAEAFVLRLGEKNSRLDRVTGSGKSEKITAAKLDGLVRGTDISYEDLALKFLYWTNAIVEKEQETLMTRSCWIVRAVPSSKGESQYDMVRLWIEPTGGLLQGECYIAGKLIRRFKVTDVQRAHDTGGFILKSMSIERMDERGKPRSRTNLFVKQ